MSRARRDKLRLPQGLAGFRFTITGPDTETGFYDVESDHVSRAEMARLMRVERVQRRIARRKHRQRFAKPSGGARRQAEAAWQRASCHFTYERTGEPAEHYVMPVATDFYAGGIVTPAELRRSIGFPGDIVEDCTNHYVSLADFAERDCGVTLELWQREVLDALCCKRAHFELRA